MLAAQICLTLLFLTCLDSAAPGQCVISTVAGKGIWGYGGSEQNKAATSERGISASPPATAEGLIDLQRGTETIKPYKLYDSGQIREIASSNEAAGLLTTLPPEVMKHDPKLLGISDYDSDGRTEVFIAWHVEIPPETFFTQFRAYRIDSRKIAALFLESRIEYLLVDLYFPVVPGGRRINAAVLRGLGGGYWGAYYVIFPNSKKLVEFMTGSRLKLGDLDGDGTYEWIMLLWRGDDLRCQTGIPGLGNGANVFRLSGEILTRIWPLPDWIAAGGDDWGKTYLVTNRFYDMDDDGRSEIVAATDVRANPQPRLSVYKLRQGHFDRLAHVNISSTYAVTEIMGIRRLRDRKQVVLRLADSKRCLSHELPYERDIIAEGFDFKNRDLAQSWINEDLGHSKGVVKDIDGNGEEEMIFSGSTVEPTLLRGIKEFLPYTPSK